VRSLLNKLLPGFPIALAWSLLLGVGFALFITWDQWHWWNTREDYSFGFLVPVFLGLVVWDRWDRARGLLGMKVPEKVDTELSFGYLKRFEHARWLRVVVTTFFGAALAFSLLVFSIGALYRAGAGPSNPGSLFIALGGGGTVFAMLMLMAPTSRDEWPQGLPEEESGMRRRLSLVALFWFPCFIWVVSAPLVNFIEHALSLFLQHKVVSVVFFVFDMGGFALEQQGNNLILPNGVVGVAEACSGIRSLTGCIFAGSFLGAVFLKGLTRKVLLILFAVILAFLTNLGRSLFLTAWAYNYGPEAIEGTVHDVAGHAVLILTSALLFCLIPLLKIKIEID